MADLDLAIDHEKVEALKEQRRRLWNDRRVVDGGMASQAPLPEPNEGVTMVLLTRDYSRLPEVEGRHYVAPAQETAADKIDFTNPQKLRDTWAQGERDAQRLLDQN